jgi:bifunctional non-homologous end joining protein LigD
MHLYEGMQQIKRGTCPFVNLPERRPGRWGQAITPSVMKRCVWVEPVLVAQVKFAEWTSDNQLRQPVFLGLRSDKKPMEVVRE